MEIFLEDGRSQSEVLRIVNVATSGATPMDPFPAWGADFWDAHGVGMGISGSPEEMAEFPRRLSEGNVEVDGGRFVVDGPPPKPRTGPGGHVRGPQRAEPTTDT